MSYFKNYTIIILCLFLNINALSYRLLQKYGEVENSDGTVIFESKDFSDGNKMYFRVSLEQECKSDLKYKYYSTKEEIFTILLIIRYHISSQILVKVKIL